MDNCRRQPELPRQESAEFEDNNHQDIRTSDVYKTDSNLPYRFEHPSKWNYGNCVFSASQEILQKYAENDDASCAVFGSRKTHPLFRTTNSDYGSQPPCVHTMPHTYHPRHYKQWEQLASFGMYRNRGFNTAVDRKLVWCIDKYKWKISNAVSREILIEILF